MKGYDISIKQQGAVNGREKNSPVMIVIIPVIQRSVVFANKQVIVTFKIVLDNYTFNAHGKVGWRTLSKPKDTFTHEG
jgi:hypothetical protein